MSRSIEHLVAGRRRVPLEPLAQRFRRQVDVLPDGCWQWTGAVNPQTGYGVIGRGRRSDGVIAAHRASFELHKGEIPAGLLICHTCDNRWCVNPEHLYAGTYSDNLNDARARGRR